MPTTGTDAATAADPRAVEPAGTADVVARPRRRPVVVALRAVLLGLVPVVGLAVALEAAAGSPAPWLAAARVGALVWSLALGGSLSVGDVQLGVQPLGLTAVLAVPLWRAGRRLGTVSAGARVAAVTGLALWFGAAAAGVTALAASASVSGSPVRAGIGGALLAAVTAGWASRGTSREPTVVSDPPARAAVVRGGLVAAGTLLAGGALLAAVAVASAVVDVGAAAGRIGGGPGPLVVQLAYVPDAAVWATAFLLGPGFAVGAGETVSPFGVGVPHLLPMPFVAALPQPGYAPGLGLAALVVPAVAGVLAARALLARLPGTGLAPGRAAALAALCGPVAAVPVAALAVLSSGSAGTPAVGSVGPSVLAVAAACAAEVALTAAAAAWLAAATRPPLPGRLDGEAARG